MIGKPGSRLCRSPARPSYRHTRDIPFKAVCPAKTSNPNWACRVHHIVAVNKTHHGYSSQHGSNGLGENFGGVAWEVALAAGGALYVFLVQTVGRRFRRSLKNNDIAFWMIS